MEEMEAGEFGSSPGAAGELTRPNFTGGWEVSRRGRRYFKPSGEHAKTAAEIEAEEGRKKSLNNEAC